MLMMYLRKSRADGDETVEQVLRRHETILQEFAVKKYGYPVPEQHILREVVSGETIQDRPMMQKLLSLIESGSVDAVLVVDIQRLSRGDLRDCGTIIRAFQYTETLVSTPQKEYCLSDKYDRKFLEMELMRGNDYLEYVKEIMLRGRIASASEGNFIGSVPPYGYDKVRDGKSYTLAENAESDIVRLIFQLYAEEGLGSCRICSRLNEMGVKPRKSDRWAPKTVMSILENPVYTGKIRWNCRKTIKKYENGEITKTRPVSDPETWILVDGKHPAIISEELFRKAQERRGTIPRAKKITEISNPFAGLVRCECGAAMVSRPNDKAQLRIICGRQTYCHNKSAIFKEFQDEVIRSMREEIERLTIRSEQEDTSKPDAQQFTLGVLRKEALEIEKQQQKIYELLEKGIYSEKTFLQRDALLSARRASNQKAMEEAELHLRKTRSIREQILKLEDAVTCIQDITITPRVKNEMLRSVIREITYTRKVSRYDKTPFSLKILYVV